MKFKDTKFSREKRFTIGEVEGENRYFLSFPVTTKRFADFEEYQEISEEEYKLFCENLDNALDLLAKCRERKEDHRLFTPPGKNRGYPC